MSLSLLANTAALETGANLQPALLSAGQINPNTDLAWGASPISFAQLSPRPGQVAGIYDNSIVTANVTGVELTILVLLILILIAVIATGVFTYCRFKPSNPTSPI